MRGFAGGRGELLLLRRAPIGRMLDQPGTGQQARRRKAAPRGRSIVGGCS